MEIAFAQDEIDFSFLCVCVLDTSGVCLAMNLDHTMVLLVSVSESK